MESCKQQIDFVKEGLRTRTKLLREKAFPGINDVLHQHGKDLTKVVLDNMSYGAKMFMGTEVQPREPLSYCGDEYTSKDDHIRALTHKTILEIGITVEQKIEQRFSKELQRVIEEIAAFERFDYEKRLKYYVAEEKKKFAAELEELKNSPVKEVQRATAPNTTIATYNNTICQRDSDSSDLTNIYLSSSTSDMQKLIMKHSRMSKKSQERHTSDDSVDSASPVTDLSIEVISFQQLQNAVCQELIKRLKVQSNIMECNHVTSLIHFACAQKAHYQKKIGKLHDKYKQEADLLKRATQQFGEGEGECEDEVETIGWGECDENLQAENTNYYNDLNTNKPPETKENPPHAPCCNCCADCANWLDSFLQGINQQQKKDCGKELEGQQQQEIKTCPMRAVAAVAVPQAEVREIFCDCPSASSSEESKLSEIAKAMFKNKELPAASWSEIEAGDSEFLSPNIEEPSSECPSSASGSTCSVQQSYSSGDYTSLKEIQEKILNTLNVEKIVEDACQKKFDNNLKTEISRRIKEEIKKITEPPQKQECLKDIKAKNKLTNKRKSVLQKTTSQEIELPIDICEKEMDKTILETWKRFIPIPSYLLPMNSENKCKSKSTKRRDWIKFLPEQD